ncbi:MAG: chromate transporter [Bacillota bacterium]
MIYLELFLSFFQVGLFSFGGGYAALPLIREQVLEVHSWLTPTEFMDILAISQMTPGPIAINASTFVGTKIAGLPGALAATVGCVAPSCIIVLILAILYYKYKGLDLVEGIIKGLRPAVVALIASAGLSVLKTVILNKASFPIRPADIDMIAALLFIAALLLLRKFKINPIHAMLMAGVAGIIAYNLLPA